MAGKGVMVFEGQMFEPAASFKAYAPLLWGYRPSLEQQARQFLTYLCKKVAPYEVSFSGDAASQHTPRCYGLVYTTDPGANFRQFKDVVVPAIGKCGIKFLDT